MGGAGGLETGAASLFLVFVVRAALFGALWAGFLAADLVAGLAADLGDFAGLEDAFDFPFLSFLSGMARVYGVRIRVLQNISSKNSSTD